MSKQVLLIGLLALVMSVMSVPRTTYAHFIVEDNKTGVKALFHVTPDHNPVAGKESVISFDFSKTDYTVDDFTYELEIVAVKGDTVAVPFEVAGNIILANYTFPSQGYYAINLVVTAKNGSAVSKLQYGQRVSRGAVQKEESFSPVVIASIVGTLVIAMAAVVIGFKDDFLNKRKLRNDQA